MNKHYIAIIVALIMAGWAGQARAQAADPASYLSGLKQELQKKWPDNRTINLVFHGHSVPSGYAATPLVRTLHAYPHLLLKKLKSIYPYAVINVITTSIGGENSEQGAKRFKKDVLPLRPDVICIDYALNDRAIGLERSRKAMERMIRVALKKHIKVILMTPSPDTRVDLTKAGNVLEQFADMLKGLAAKYHIGLCDSYQRFKELAEKGADIKSYMAQVNHPDEKGHEVIASELIKYFE